MAVKDLLDVVAPLQVSVPGASLPYLRAKYLEAAIDFCQRSEAYTTRMDPLTTVEGVAEYDLEIPTGTRVERVLAIRYLGAALKPTSETLLDAESSNWEVHSGEPVFFIHRHNQVTLYPKPNATVPISLTGRVALQPVYDATEVDSEFFDQFHSAVMHGALQRCYEDLRQPWGDPQSAERRRQLFEAEIQREKSRARGDQYDKLKTVRYGGL